MSPRLSTYLDFLRFSAAIVVLLSHFAYERFSGGGFLFIRELNLGSDAVVVFFVLSGFVIAYAAEAKDKIAQTYFFNRATRLYSVIIPALAMTFVLDQLGSKINPQAYDGWWYQSLPLWSFFAHGLTFTNEWPAMVTRLGSNGPFWSISYEVAYYILFGAAIFTKGFVRIILLPLLAFMFGLNILLLLPIWLMGVAAYQVVKKQRHDKPHLENWLYVALFVPPILYVFALAQGLPALLTQLTTQWIGQDPNLAFRFSDEVIWNSLIGAGFAVHLTAAAFLFKADESPAIANKSSKMIKWLAGASFSIYLVHYPLLQFLSAVLPKSGMLAIDNLLLMSITIAICFGFAQIFERSLEDFRNLCRRVLRLKLKTRISAQ